MKFQDTDSTAMVRIYDMHSLVVLMNAFFRLGANLHYRGHWLGSWFIHTKQQWLHFDDATRRWIPADPRSLRGSLQLHRSIQLHGILQGLENIHGPNPRIQAPLIPV